MLSRVFPQKSSLSILCLAAGLVMVCTETGNAEESSVLLRPGFSSDHKQRLIEKLRVITGWTGLAFTDDGKLQLPSAHFKEGSAGARTLIHQAMAGDTRILLESVNNRSDVVFCNVAPVSWLASDERTRIYLLRIDFADYENLLGDRRAREAFNVAWGVLHEFEHVVNESRDSLLLGDAGECEANINLMRRELGLPERTEYLFTFMPANGRDLYKSRFVRLAFEQRNAGSRAKRYWLIWDAALVGGLPKEREVALTR